MAQRLNVTPKKTTQPTKPIVLIALSIAFVLSCCLTVKLSNQHKVHYAKKTLSLPQLPVQEEKAVVEDNGWRIISPHSGDSLASIFSHLGLSRQSLQAILDKNPHAKALTSIRPGQKLKFLIRKSVLEKMIIPLTPVNYLVVSHTKNGYISKMKAHKTDTHTEYLTATVRGSLYGTAKRLNISSKLIQQMTNIFNWEIDFIRDIRAGDQFSIVYNAYYIHGKQVSTGDILAVTYTNRGVPHQAIRHTNGHGDFDYFTAQGTSLKKAFSRYPIKFSHISSTFSLSRNHPILHYHRPHRGVDLAASIGTPVHATGNGRVEIIDRHNGYGNMIKISHDRTYSSLYAHLLKFQKGLARGDFVRRGQIIGYVGQSGLATGPHCHYEFHVKHQPRNPTTIELPRASPVPSREMASFKAKAGTLLAQLKLYEEATLAAAGHGKPKTA